MKKISLKILIFFKKSLLSKRRGCRRHEDIAIYSRRGDEVTTNTKYYRGVEEFVTPNEGRMSLLLTNTRDERRTSLSPFVIEEEQRSLLSSKRRSCYHHSQILEKSKGLYHRPRGVYHCLKWEIVTIVHHHKKSRGGRGAIVVTETKVILVQCRKKFLPFDSNLIQLKT